MTSVHRPNALERLLFTDTRPQKPLRKFALLCVIVIRVIVHYLDHLLVTRPENSRQTIQ